MKVSEGLQEDGIVVGNNYNKYGSVNPIVKIIMKGFDKSLSELVARARPAEIHEVGCGEGFWVLKWIKEGISARGSDFSETVINLARENAVSASVDPSVFSAKSIYDLSPKKDGADLIVCCEVMEHLEDPARGLESLAKIARNHLIISVPNEPIWRVLNLVRGRYLSDMGNTPGHIQHWSGRSFQNLVSKYFDIIEVRTPLPWTMILCKVRTDKKAGN